MTVAARMSGAACVAIPFDGFDLFDHFDPGSKSEISIPKSEITVMDNPHFDVIVIGTGPGGEGAAMQAAKHGKSVAVVERHTRVGGSCTHLATIPSKALRFAIFQMTEANNNKLFREAGISVNLSFPDL